MYFPIIKLTLIVTLIMPKIGINHVTYCNNIFVRLIDYQLVALAHHFGHTVDTMLKTYAHFFTETEQALISDFDIIIENEMISNRH